MINAEVMIGVLNALMIHKPLIQSALDRQQGEGFTFQNVFDLVKNEQMLFFWNSSSCAVIEVRNYPGEIILHVFLGAGTTDGLLELYDYVASWGSTYVGASKMTTLCRKGFKRKLAKHGWKDPQVWLVKRIETRKETVQ
jgi:hypothetical protein